METHNPVCPKTSITPLRARAGEGVWLWLLLFAVSRMFCLGLSAQETLPPSPNPYSPLGVPPGPYSSGVGRATSGAPDEPIPGFVNGEVNPLILGWAAEITNYSPANPAAIDGSWKNTDTVLHPVTGNVFDVVSLGDLSAADITRGVAPGSLTVRFAQPVGDGPGPDLVIFGNAFQLARSTRVFAKLAYVEVSTDGLVFARFPSVDTNSRPVGAGWPYITSDATKIYNLFGKAVNAYGPSWGNPFDLRDLAGNPLVQSGAVDLQNILYVRLVAIPGSGSYQDSFGNPIYCPWPTFGSPGPEVQAIGYLNLGHAREPSAPHAPARLKPVAPADASPNSSPAASAPVAAASHGPTVVPFAGSLASDPVPAALTQPAATEVSIDDAGPAISSDDDPAVTDAIAQKLAIKAKGRPSLANKPSLGLPSVSAAGEGAGGGQPSALPTYDDQSLRPSGVQARLNSFGPTLWGKAVQRVAYLTGWDMTPASLAAIFLGCGAAAFLLLRYFCFGKRDSTK